MLAVLLMDLIAERYKTSGHSETPFSANCPHDFLRGILPAYAAVDVVRNNGERKMDTALKRRSPTEIKLETLWSHDMHSNQATVHQLSLTVCHQHGKKVL